MVMRNVATVFGGSGFLGRYVVQRLRLAGHVVRVASRDPGNTLYLRQMGPTGQVVPLYARFDDPSTLRRAVEGASLVVNLIGILAETRSGDFMRVHAEIPATIATLSREAGVEALAHVSAIGAAPDSDALYGRSKAEGEARLRAAFPQAAILRPSLVFGREDQFFNRFGSLARYSPVMPVICGDSLMQPVFVGDVADAIVAAAHTRAPGLWELGGPEVLTFREILRRILEMTGRNRPLLEIPAPVARLQAAFAELVPGKPLTRDQVKMLGRDNVVSPGAADLASLGIVPTPIGLVVPDYLSRYRVGGARSRVPA